MTDDIDTTDNPFFARLWTFMSNHETEEIQQLRTRESRRADRPGARSGCGHRYQLRLLPDDGDRGRRRRTGGAARAAGAGSGRKGARSRHGERRHRREVSDRRRQPFDAVVCSLVLCSVDDPDSVLRQLYSLLRPGGELRFLEHVATGGFRGRLQKVADATVWPRMMGNCHTHRDTESSIVGAGFAVQAARREPTLPALVPDAGRRVHDRPRHQARG